MELSNIDREHEFMGNVDLIEKAVLMGEGHFSSDGAFIVNTGASTGRSTKERFIVRHPEVEEEVSWGGVNQPISCEWADKFFEALESRVEGGPHFDMTGFVGCFQVTVKSKSPWHIAFAKNMFRQERVETLKGQIPDDIHVQIYHDPYSCVSDLNIGHPYEKAIILDLVKMRVGIIGTAYAGEIKKSAFTLCNFIFPKYGLLPMHSSANCAETGKESSILFGLSGTGKTTLSADPHRFLIGDDEIVWSANGISNLEGGCYAKLIDLDKSKEPDIFKAANRFGSVLENVSFNSETRTIDFNDRTRTENTRASYSMSALEKVFNQNLEVSPPSSIVFLTADAFGALPAVARLNEWQAQYHFISGYTAKVAGTEIGVVSPEATFSNCFGAPFMPRKSSVYGELLSKFIKKYNVPVWLLNTGWTNGGYGKGDRFPIPVSRGLLAKIQSGELEKVEKVCHPIFGFEVPIEVPGVDKSYLKIPEGPQVKKLAERFVENAKMKSIPQEVVDRGGPQITAE